MFQGFISGKNLMTGQFVREKIEETGISLADVARGLSITPQSLNERLSVKDVKVGALAEIANVIGKDIYYFLDGYMKTLSGAYVEEPEAMYKVLQQKIENNSIDIQQLIRAKDDIIEAQRKTISAYEQMIANFGRN